MASTGTIVRIVGARGFGFIQDEQGKELFFHASGVEGGAFDQLREGLAVEYDRESDPRGKGDRATNIRLR